MVASSPGAGARRGVAIVARGVPPGSTVRASSSTAGDFPRLGAHGTLGPSSARSGAPGPASAARLAQPPASEAAMPTSGTACSTGGRSWQDLLGEHFVDLDVVPSAEGPLRGEVRSRAVGSLQLSRVRPVDQRAGRTARLARTDRRHFVQVGLVERGSARVEQDGRECWLQPGDYALYETHRPFSWELRAGTGPAWSLLVLTWCRPGPTSPGLTARRMDGSSGLTGVLGRMMTDLLRTRDVVGTDPGDRLAGELLELVTTAAGAAPPPPAGPPRGDRALLAAVRAHVEEHLADPALDPRSIAAAHFVSVRQLHRL